MYMYMYMYVCMYIYIYIYSGSACLVPSVGATQARAATIVRRWLINIMITIIIIIIVISIFLHSRNRHLRNHRGFQWRFPMDCQFHVPTEFHFSDFWRVAFCPESESAWFLRMKQLLCCISIVPNMRRICE